MSESVRSTRRARRLVVGRAEVRDLVEDPHWGGDHERGGCSSWGGSLHGVEAAQGGQGRAIAALQASRPGRRNSAADSELAQLRADNARLSATVIEQAIELAALRGKAAWG